MIMAPTNPVIQEAEQAKECLQDYPEIQLLNTIVCDRKVYRNAMSDGFVVVEKNNPKSKAEVLSLMSEVFMVKRSAAEVPAHLVGKLVSFQWGQLRDFMSTRIVCITESSR